MKAVPEGTAERKTELVEAVLQGFADLESSGLAGRDFDRFAGAGIAGAAGGAFLGFKGAKADQLHFVASLQGFGNHVHKSGQGLFSVLLGQFSFLSQSGDQLRFVHE